jgi:hypothetical protein
MPAMQRCVGAVVDQTSARSVVVALAACFLQMSWVRICRPSIGVGKPSNRRFERSRGRVFVGGRTAEVAGRVQFIFLIVYIFLMITFYIFRPYQGRVGAFLRSHPMQYVALLVCTVILAFALLLIGFTVHSIVRDDI